MSIPRVIHQTWKTEAIPPLYQPFVDSVRTHHPGWEHRLWTDADNLRFIQERFPWFLETFVSYRHDIERADAVRYFLLYEFGGIYVDLDMECLRPFDDLVREEGVHFSLEAGPTLVQQVISNAFMAAPPRHPFFHGLIHELADIRGPDVTFGDVFRNTGPDMLHAQCIRRRDEHVIHVIGLDRICPKGVLSQNVLLPSRDIDEIRERTLLYAIHHNTESWNTQYPAPSAPIPGYTLFRGHDVPGFDIDFVQNPGPSFKTIRAACDAEEGAIGFNFNGYIKGRGGTLERQDGRTSWLKEGVEPWVCIKNDRLDLVRRGS
jgi:mannosyltransferase OCH1-like enzyme